MKARKYESTIKNNEKGQVTIPKSKRNIFNSDVLEFKVHSNGV
ncbi:MAG: hypothetical protein ACUVRK_00385 [Spirochaetota bacterium]